MVEGSEPSRPAPPKHGTSADPSTARFELPAEEFGLAGLFEQVPDARVEIDPLVASPADQALIVIHSDGSRQVVDAALRSDPTVGAVEYFTKRADEWIYQITWQSRPRQLIQCLVDVGVSVLSIQGQTGQWNLRLLSSDRDGIAQAHDALEDLGCAVEWLTISTLDGDVGRSTLTDDQHEAVVAGSKEGFYNIPRDITLEDLAADLDVSHQALSERLRRAHGELVDRTLIADTEQEQ